MTTKSRKNKPGSPCTHGDLLRLIKYSPETGHVVWLDREPNMFEDGKIRCSKEAKCKRWNSKHSGSSARVENGKNNNTISINGRRHKSNIIIWFYMTGEWPVLDVDHKDGNHNNEKFDNLRLATPSQNGANSKIPKSNKSGLKGVCWHRKAEKWMASGMKDYRQYYLGLFDCRLLLTLHIKSGQINALENLRGSSNDHQKTTLAGNRK